ncbi:MAG TPA: LacI family DNA-binding transcriptional regulator [Micromonosporaceae bacterium]|nr:LacI family DNA-binding transcriptional regulator [Micromonosporaceae bacterium]
MQRVKLADVARAAGVHPGTASRALNPLTRDQVSRETSRRVARAAERLGYVPNQVARGLRTARSYIVAMLVPDVTNPLFPPMVRAAEQVLSRAGYTLVLTDTDNDAASERRQVEVLRARGADGFIIATATWQDPLLDEIADARIPAVLVNRNTASARLPYVGADERYGIRLAVDHLVALGHRRISYVAGPQDTSTGRERAAAFRQAVRGHGLPTGRGQVRACTAYTEAAGAAAARSLLASGTDATAILAGNDLIAFGVLSELAAAGIPCPGRMSVIGFNDLPLVDKLTPPLTTVRLPLHEMGSLAARILLGEIDATSSNGRVAQSLLGVDLAVRGTTAPPAS